MNDRALIFGAKSAIAQALARRLAQSGYDLVLAARQSDSLAPFAADLNLHTGVQVDRLEFDADDTAALVSLPADIEARFGPFSLAVQVFGYLGNQAKTTADQDEMQRVLHLNFTAAALLLSHMANHLEKSERPGGLISISSVAGDRGRQSNYFYGAAKGALALFLQGLRNRLAHTQLHVLTVKPGFVDTPMTRGMPGLFLVASPDKVAADIVRAYQKKKDILYTPWFWRYIMLIIKTIPESLFKKLKL
jgi:decaprenylphospho-beta-D-erythro-pentofuranosid-2-ulose 2-reductase